MSRIFWDTNLFIYLFEKHPEYWQQVKELREKMLTRKDELITSTITLAEVQVKPRKLGRFSEAENYRSAISQTATVVSFDAKVADEYVRIRSETTVRGPDAMQLACAAAVGTELFLTNNIRLQKLKIAGIHFITSVERSPI